MTHVLASTARLERLKLPTRRQPILSIDKHLNAGQRAQLVPATARSSGARCRLAEQLCMQPTGPPAALCAGGLRRHLAPELSEHLRDGLDALQHARPLARRQPRAEACAKLVRVPAHELRAHAPPRRLGARLGRATRRVDRVAQSELEFIPTERRT